MLSVGAAPRLYNVDFKQLELELGRVLEMAVEGDDWGDSMCDVKLQWVCDNPVARTRLVKTENPSAC
jgi:hypothetical protein